MSWSNHPLGAFASWPASLKNTLIVLLQCEAPMLLLWGADHYLFYNDAFLKAAGEEVLVNGLAQEASKTLPAFWELIRNECKTVFISGKNLISERVYKESFFKCYYSAILNDEGKPGGVLLNCADLSDYIKMQKKLSQKLAELELDNKNREQFVSLLTHDLRNPLTAAKISAQAIERSNMPREKLARFLSRILSNLNRAELMIENMLDANRIKAGEKLNLKLVDFEMVSFIKEVLIDLTLIHGQRFIFNYSEALIDGCWSQDGIRRIVENLCNNAIKFGNIDTPVTINLTEQDEHIELSVHNMGPGIPEKEQKLLFDPHQRRLLDNNAPKGWGLGLTLVKGITDAHGGRIELTSNSAHGTTFKIILPN